MTSTSKLVIPVSFSTLILLGYLSKRITSTTIYQRYTRDARHRYFHRGNHKGENATNILRIVLSLRQYHKMEKPKNNMSPATLSLYLPTHPLSFKARMRERELCIKWGGNLPIYILLLSDLLNQLGHPEYLIGDYLPRNNSKYNFLHLFWGLFPRLTIEGLPQWPYILMTS